MTVGCAITTPGNGPTHAVRLSVRGGQFDRRVDREPRSVGTNWSDIIPPPPTNLAAAPVDHGLRITWTKPSTSGAASPIDQYVLTVGGSARTIDVDDSRPGAEPSYARIVRADSIPNGAATAYSVSARNRAPNSLATWNAASGTATPAGPPLVAASPTASASLTDGTSASVAWSGAFSSNGKAISDYYISISSNGSAPPCTVTGVDTGNPGAHAADGQRAARGRLGVVDHLQRSAANRTYTFVVFAYNGQGCTASASGAGHPARGARRCDRRDDRQRRRERRPASGTSSVGVLHRVGSSDVDSFELPAGRRTVDSSQSDPVDFGSFLPRPARNTATTSSVQVRGCREYTEVRLCSPTGRRPSMSARRSTSDWAVSRPS